MELKYSKPEGDAVRNKSSNRTFMELKYYLYRQQRNEW